MCIYNGKLRSWVSSIKKLAHHKTTHSAERIGHGVNLKTRSKARIAGEAIRSLVIESFRAENPQAKPRTQC
jgi:hypothetical protein